METTKLRRFAQYARRSLIEQTSAKLEFVLANDSSARREFPKAVADLEKQVALSGREQVIEKVAYTWFNRFCALRFMDLNGYNRIRVISPADESQFQPEILAEAKAGHLDDEMIQESHRQRISNLLSGTSSSSDPQQEAYRLLIVSTCNYWHKSMGFMFEKIEDYTELLIPNDLLSGNSILAYTREAMTPYACKDVEVIGWLYQFYISEKKDQVFEALKKNKKVEPENIPAATQLFTPHWIVRYLVENSLGRLWMLNHPKSNLTESMDFYIKPEKPETDFLIIRNPEELKICDPACGSGHMLTYAFDLLYEIYEEFGTDPSEIPEKILIHNLFGIEIDERAGELAAFALTMKARGKQRRFFSKSVKPNICVLQKVTFDREDLNEYISTAGSNLFTANLHTLLTQFEEADNFGSLIRPVVMDYSEVCQQLEDKGISGQLLLEHIHEDVLSVLKQSEYLSQRYAVVVANPPYMGGKGMNNRLGAWAKDKYPDSKSDLFAMFIERGFELIPMLGYSAMVTMQSWMFLSSYEKLRASLTQYTSIESMLHMDNMVMGISFGTAATVWNKNDKSNVQGAFCYVEYEDIDENGKPAVFPPKNARNRLAFNKTGEWYFRRSANDFGVIPSRPIAYWVSESLRNAFQEFPSFSEFADTRSGLVTGENECYIRNWQEISFNKAGFNFTRVEAKTSGKKWFPQSKGGDFRRWYGNHQTLLDWENDGSVLQTRMHDSGTRILAHNFNLDKIFLPSITWTKLSSGSFGARFQPKGFIFHDASANAFPLKPEYSLSLLAFLSSKIPVEILKVMNPTLNFLPGNVSSLPFLERLLVHPQIIQNCKKLISVSKSDWDSYEISWDFLRTPLLITTYRQSLLEETYKSLRNHWQTSTQEMQKLEQENNRIFIEAYGLQDELDEFVPLKEISIACNPQYRYSGNKTEAALEVVLLAETMREFISYAVGCMFGRYSVDKEGLVLANQGQTLADYLQKIPEPRFMPDEDNVIPILDGDWFSDDITERFRLFLRVTFGEDKYEENLRFIEIALGNNGKPLLIRDYFLKEFYNDHVKRYKKRPIYWMFSSPRGSFNALMYMHRYRPDTVSVVLNDYLREFRTKLNAHKSHLEQVSISLNASAGEKTKAIKDVESLKKVLVELEDYERDVLYPLATRQIEIDLDDGVKKNYSLFGTALKKIVGLDVGNE